MLLLTEFFIFIKQYMRIFYASVDQSTWVLPVYSMPSLFSSFLCKFQEACQAHWQGWGTGIPSARDPALSCCLWLHTLPTFLTLNQKNPYKYFPLSIGPVIIPLSFLRVQAQFASCVQYEVCFLRYRSPYITLTSASVLRDFQPTFCPLVYWHKESPFMP